MKKFLLIIVSVLLLLPTTGFSTGEKKDMENISSLYSNNFGIYYHEDSHQKNNAIVKLHHINGYMDDNKIIDFNTHLIFESGIDLQVKTSIIKYNIESGFYEAWVDIVRNSESLNSDIGSTGKILLNPEKNILTLIMLDSDQKPSTKVTINSLEPKESLNILNEEITRSAADNSISNNDIASDANIRVNSNKNSIYMQFVGQNGMSNGNKRRFSFRTGITQVPLRSPTMATMNFLPTKYSHGGGLSIYDVYPKGGGGINVGVSYSFGIVNVGYSLARSMYSIGANSANSRVTLDITKTSDAYWTGSNSSTGGLAGDFYIEMLSGGTSGCRGFNVNTSFEVVDGGTGHTFTQIGPSTNGCITRN